MAGTRKRKRINICVKNSTLETLKKIARYQAVSLGVVIDQVTEQKLQDPVQVLEDERKQLAIRINEIAARIDQIKGGDDE